MDADRYQFLINDLIEHKKYVLESCKRMSQYLYKEGNYELWLNIATTSFNKAPLVGATYDSPNISPGATCPKILRLPQ